MSLKLSVILPVYNAESYVGLALESILKQSFGDFELIVINDGSTDKSLSILQRFARKDKRIKLISRENRGLVASLNEGIKLANGTYVARHDADDLSKIDRFAQQVTFLDKHKGVVIIGSSVAVMNESGTILHEHRVLLNDPELRQELLVRSPFAHGSVMFHRAHAIKAGLYRQDYWPAEDYDFWLRLSKFGGLANIDEPLYIYREHTGSISSTRQQAQIEQANRVRTDAWHQVSVLLRGRIRISTYKKLPHAEHRIPRIFANIMAAQKLARTHRRPIVATKLMGMVALDSTTYRKIGGHLKRKVSRP